MEAGKCDVDAVLVVLVQETVFTCNPGEEDECKRKEILVMSEDRNEEDADPGETQTYKNLKLKIDRQYITKNYNF